MRCVRTASEHASNSRKARAKRRRRLGRGPEFEDVLVEGVFEARVLAGEVADHLFLKLPFLFAGRLRHGLVTGLAVGLLLLAEGFVSVRGEIIRTDNRLFRGMSRRDIVSEGDITALLRS